MLENDDTTVRAQNVDRFFWPKPAANLPATDAQRLFADRTRQLDDRVIVLVADHRRNIRSPVTHQLFARLQQPFVRGSHENNRMLLTRVLEVWRRRYPIV